MVKIFSTLENLCMLTGLSLSMKDRKIWDLNTRIKEMKLNCTLEVSNLKLQKKILWKFFLNLEMLLTLQSVITKKMINLWNLDLLSSKTKKKLIKQCNKLLKMKMFLVSLFLNLLSLSLLKVKKSDWSILRSKDKKEKKLNLKKWCMVNLTDKWMDLIWTVLKLKCFS